ncbi:MAG: flagellar biosynthesis protein FlhF [Hyphomonadaceae bacterium]|nr:MAG: flagellar biosynthesis protein FlhF [Hyphomonadaceae bacterium]KAF0185922.1 MAG: flagellar biosynthesis protein FlhF [Hyphomonadaceae bacterium]
MEQFRFSGDTLQDAVVKVRSKLGADATIISWRNMGTGIEVTATARKNRSQPQTATGANKAPRYDIFAAEEEIAQTRTSAPIIKPTPQKGTKALVKGVVNTKIPPEQILAKKAAILANKPAARPKIHPLVGILAKSGLSLPQIKPFAKYFDDADVARTFIKILEKEFNYSPIAQVPDGIILLAGPSGCGKTTTTAKLVARAIAKGGEVMALSTDCERQGGMEQLRNLVHKLGAQFASADSVKMAKEIALEAVADGKTVFIDTAASSQFDPSSMRILARLIDETGAEPILCATTDSRSDDLSDLFGEFKEVGVKRAILTRMDLTLRRAGPLVGLHKHEMAIAQLAPSPYISGGIVPATPKRLAQLILEAWEV